MTGGASVKPGIVFQYSGTKLTINQQPDGFFNGCPNGDYAMVIVGVSDCMAASSLPNTRFARYNIDRLLLTHREWPNGCLLAT